MALVTILLALAAVMDSWGVAYGAIAGMTLAMGAENALFERDGEVSIGLTYMTGTLVKLGQRLTEALLGGDRWAWLWYFMLWAGLALGASVGALAYERFGLGGLWFAAAASALLTAIIGAISGGTERSAATAVRR